MTVTPASSLDFEAEFDRFAASLLGTKNTDSFSDPGLGGPRQSISAESIYKCALDLVERDGIDALTVRRLAAELKISTRTLYKRIQSREHMLGQIATAFAATLDLTVRTRESWRSTVLGWCVQLHTSLTAQPHLADLVSDQIIERVSDSVGDLICRAVADGISRNRAVTCCQSLVRMTINDALAQNRLVRRADSSGRTKPDEVLFVDTIALILDGTATPQPSEPNQAPRSSAALDDAI